MTPKSTANSPVGAFGLLAATCIMAVLLVLACAAPVPVEQHPKATRPVQPEPDPHPRESPQSLLPTIHFTIQVGAFSTAERAAHFAVLMQNIGLDAYYFIDGDGLYKVRFERFADKEAARRRAFQLKARGKIDDFYLVHPGPAADRVNPLPTLRNNIVQTAHRFIGTPYRWGGESARSGFDCSGLTMTVYRLNGLDLPRNSRAQYRAGTPVQRGSIQKGDLVFFATNGRGRVSHVGIYAGQGKFVHAPGSGKRIRTASLSNSYFRRRFMGARRYF